MRQLLALGALCVLAVPAQQIHISGSRADVGEARVLNAAEPGDNFVVTLPGPGPVERAVTLPGSLETSLPLAVVPGPGAAPPALPVGPKATSSPRPPLDRVKPFLPTDFERDSGFFCQKLIGAWTERDAYNLFGDPVRQRPAFDSEHTLNGRVYAYSDPTGRYRQIELDFAQETGLLRTVFVYPRKMSWQECRRLWGTEVQATEANKGRTFYSYVNRRLDVLVDASGNVISLGLY